MKTAIMFAVASLILVSAVVVFALPSPVQAAKKTWELVAVRSAGEVFTFKNKHLCLQKQQELEQQGSPIDEPCHLVS